MTDLLRPQNPQLNLNSPQAIGLADCFPGESTVYTALRRAPVTYGTTAMDPATDGAGKDRWMMGTLGEPICRTIHGDLHSPGGIQRAITYPTRVIPQYSPFTISAWIWGSPDSGGWGQLIMELGGTGDWTVNWKYYSSATTHYITAQLIDMGSYPLLTVPTSFRWRPHQWVHLANVWRPPSKSFELYVNGVLATSGTATATNTRGSDQWIIGGQVTGFGLYGAGIEWRIYSRDLTAREVYGLWNPATRWDLYRRVNQRKTYGVTAAPPAAQNNAPFWFTLMSQGV